MPAGLIEDDDSMGAGGDFGGNLGQCRFIASVLQDGSTRAAPFPSFGQMAPKI